MINLESLPADIMCIHQTQKVMMSKVAVILRRTFSMIKIRFMSGLETLPSGSQALQLTLVNSGVNLGLNKIAY